MYKSTDDFKPNLRHKQLIILNKAVCLKLLKRIKRANKSKKLFTKNRIYKKMNPEMKSSI